ncbi:MAG: type VI secretion system secreted protein VgrG [Gammaproteobacteria bacterium]|jgi:type VI secretion system secreted protein VgrG
MKFTRKERTVNKIIRTVLDNADLGSGTDYDFSGLMGDFLERDYVCQFGESDFSFISRLMENEGIFYYFEQGKQGEKVVFMNSTDYAQMINAELIYDVDSKGSSRANHIFSWRCSKQNLPLNVSVRDFNSENTFAAN